MLLECVNLVSTMLSNLCLYFIVDCGIENRKYFRCDTVFRMTMKNISGVIDTD